MLGGQGSVNSLANMWKENSTNIRDLPSIQLPSIRDLTSRNSGGLLGAPPARPGPPAARRRPPAARCGRCGVQRGPLTRACLPPACPCADGLGSLGFKDFPSGNFKDMLANIDPQGASLAQQLRELGTKGLQATHREPPSGARLDLPPPQQQPAAPVPLPPQQQGQQAQQGQAPELALGPGKGGSHSGTPRTQSNGTRPGEPASRAPAAAACRPGPPGSLSAARACACTRQPPSAAANRSRAPPPTPAGSGSNPDSNNTGSGSRGAGGVRLGADAGGPPAAALAPKLSLGTGPPDAVRGAGPETDGGWRRPGCSCSRGVAALAAALRLLSCGGRRPPARLRARGLRPAAVCAPADGRCRCCCCCHCLLQAPSRATARGWTHTAALAAARGG
jgi:hypothetical protein